MKAGTRTTDGRGCLYDSIVDTVGNTPCIRINRLAPGHVTLYAKTESFNPAASVKDRLALSIIEAAERSGSLKPGQTVVEATSGNTGIGLAMVCAAKGYPLVVTMAESFSIERRKLMRMLGAKVVLTPRSPEGLRHVPEGGGAGRGARLVPGAPVRDRGQRRHPRVDHGARDHRRLRRVRASTGSSPATAPAAPSPAWRACCARERPEREARS
ncbi:MAG: pyridoxal-phosphate dependent enzyme [Halofilum sp. (in: g-proteobacteria)]|nr:pyridoxal-phosphate dependent enzyme [Halofilum sp. (in: g-proteobacteria)]